MAAIISGLIKDAGSYTHSVASTLFLQRWFNSLDDESAPHLIVLIQDVESVRCEIYKIWSGFSVLSRDDVLSKSKWMPVCLVAGFATSTDAVSSVLTHRERSLIVGRRFVPACPEGH